MSSTQNISLKSTKLIGLDKCFNDTIEKGFKLEIYISGSDSDNEDLLKKDDSYF